MLLTAFLPIILAFSTRTSARSIFPKHQKGDQPGLCTEDDPVKRQKLLKDLPAAPLDPPVCALNVGDLWYLCGEYSFLDAADACASYGWRLAVLDDANKQQAVELLAGCQGTLARGWVAGFNGVPGNPCAYALVNDPYGAVTFNSGWTICNALTMGAVCQEMPQRTTTVVETTPVLTINDGATTTTTTELATRTVRPYRPTCHGRDCHHDSSDSSSDSCSSSWWTEESSDDCSSKSETSDDCSCRHRRHHKALGPAADPKCYGRNCLPVCPYSAIGIHILDGLVSNVYQAAAECEKYGWSLLDLTNSKTRVLAELLDKCSPVFGAGYIRSFNGLSSNCTIVEPIELNPLENVAVAYPLNPQWCQIDGAEFLPVCQEQCPIATGKGSDPGQINFTPVTVQSLVTPTEATTTVVITEACTESVYIKYQV
mgnify:FL=1